MRKRQHPSDENLIDLLDDSAGEHADSRTHAEAHLRDCSMCAERLDELREFVTVLREADVWDRQILNTRPRTEWIRQASSVAQQITAEIAAAEAEVNAVLTGPSQWWRTRAIRTERAHTYGFVRKLLERADALLKSAPGDAVEATHLAVEIAHDLRIDAYPFDLVISARAHAWREHSYALFFVGRFPDALRAITRAEQLFAQLPIAEFDLARTSLIRAAIYRSTDRAAEAIPLARSTAAVFLSFGDETRYVKARMTEAALLHETGAIADALAIWTSLEDESSLREDSSFGMLLQNIGSAHARLGHHDEARRYLARAIDEHERSGNSPERVRTRWSLGSSLVGAGELRQALPVLRQAWREFDTLQMTGSSALVALEVAEVLLVMGEPDEVPSICRKVLDLFTRTGRTSRAIIALAFLREAVAAGTATPSLVQHVRAFLRDIPKYPARPFAPPPL
jgi:tetratricopeptide (TPR) repeat protein